MNLQDCFTLGDEAFYALVQCIAIADVIVSINDLLLRLKRKYTYDMFSSRTAFNTQCN